jgi:pullulanase/glycogen debranching enzyme
MTDWFKDAIIYEAHVRGFLRQQRDGIGDFPGLTQKLPYLSDLGVTCVWLLPSIRLRFATTDTTSRLHLDQSM